MKKITLVIALLLMGIALTLISSCKKNDTTPPVISITGANPYYLILGSAVYTDPGATANDDVDGVIATVTNNSSSTNPDKNNAASYVITYSATDKAGNVGTINRTVIVYNEADVLEGTYAAVDETRLDYTEHIQYSRTVNRRINFNNFAAYTGALVYGMVDQAGNITLSSTFTVPSQTVSNIGSPPANRTFNGTGNMITLSPYKFVINYVETVGTSSSNNKGTYTKQ